VGPITALNVSKQAIKLDSCRLSSSWDARILKPTWQHRYSIIPGLPKFDQPPGLPRPHPYVMNIAVKPKDTTVEMLIMHKVIMQNSHNAKLLALTELVPI